MRGRLAVGFPLLMLTLLAIPSLAGPSPTESTTREQFLGAWRLVSIETIGPKGEVTYPFYGKHPQGIIMYDRSGWISVQVVSDPAATVPKDGSWAGFVAAPPAEKAAAAEGYYAYFGTWDVDASSSTVTHHIQQSLRPGERGVDGVRHFVFEGDRLTLTAKTHEMGEDRERKLVWRRAGPDHS